MRTRKKESKKPPRETRQWEEDRGAMLEILTVVTEKDKLSVSILLGGGGCPELRAPGGRRKRQRTSTSARQYW